MIEYFLLDLRTMTVLHRGLFTDCQEHMMNCIQRNRWDDLQIAKTLG
jgi:hypothetical protein